MLVSFPPLTYMLKFSELAPICDQVCSWKYMVAVNATGIVKQGLSAFGVLRPKTRENRPMEVAISHIEMSTSYPTPCNGTMVMHIAAPRKRYACTGVLHGQQLIQMSQSSSPRRKKDIAFKIPVSLSEFCTSPCVSQLAAFFLDPRT